LAENDEYLIHELSYSIYFPAQQIMFVWIS
jgi:hypothetical protein